MLASRMAMPETAMHEKDSFIFGKDDVWSAGQIASLQPETKTEPVQERADLFFRFGIFASYM